MYSHNSNRSGNKNKKVNGVRVFQWVLVIVLFVALIVVLSLLLKSTGNGTESDPSQTQEVSGRFGADTTINGISVDNMSPDEARAALADSIAAQIDGFSLTLTYQTSTWVLDNSVADLATDLDTVMQTAIDSGTGAYETAVTVDSQSIAAYIQELAASIDCDPVEPTLSYSPDDATDSSPFTVTTGTAGVKVDVDATVDSILAQMALGSNGTAAIVVNETQPTTSAEDLASKVTLISSFTTEFSTSEENRCYNLQLACSKLNGASIPDGTTFSFNDVVGPRDEANGWKEAHVIIGGTRYEDGWGGGICQVSTTLYNALLRTGADYSGFSRVNHSIPSGYVDKGLDATVAYGSKDFKFTNSTGGTLYIIAYTSDTDKSTGKITFKIYGNPLPDGTTVKVYSKVVSTIDPPDPEIIYDSTEPSTYKVELQKERKGYVVEVYREILVDDVSKGAELLYTDKYNAVQGIYTVGSAVESSDNVDIPDDIPDDNSIPEETVQP